VLGINHEDSGDRTPLFLVVGKGHEVVVKLLHTIDRVKPHSQGQYGSDLALSRHEEALGSNQFTIYK